MTQLETNPNYSLNEFCNYIGRDRSLVQGGGGNVSWKDADCLWIKASGTSIGDALNANIFVPVNLNLLRRDISLGKFDVVPSLLNDSSMRASIETAMHGMLPQKYVVHLHEVNTLSRLVGLNGNEECSRLLPKKYKGAFVDYFKPGAALAAAIYDCSNELHELDFIFLKNHGVIIADDCLGGIKKKLSDLIVTFELKPRKLPNTNLPDSIELPLCLNKDFVWETNPGIHALAVDSLLLNRVRNHWALYPDHVVFLGAQPCIVRLEDVDGSDTQLLLQNSFIFVPNVGVLKHKKTKPAQVSQLLCYSDVIRRVDGQSMLSKLTSGEIAELLNWDAEKYRQRISI